MEVGTKPPVASGIKAGIMVHGRTAEGAHCLLLPGVYGRFSRDTHHFVMPKGAADPGETPVQAAMRELGEETGFWLCDHKRFDMSIEPGFLTRTQIQQIGQGADLTNITNPAFPGIVIKHFHAEPYYHEYLSRGGVQRPLHMFDVEIEGIEHLQTMKRADGQPLLKNSEGKTAIQILSEDPTRPGFNFFREWMLAGQIPAGSDHPPIPLQDGAWFKQLLETYAPVLLDKTVDKEPKRNAWKKFLYELENRHPKEYARLDDNFKRIKRFMSATGWLGNDESILKLDIHDMPLYPYTEDARVVEDKEAVGSIFHDLCTNDDYARANGGPDEVDHPMPVCARLKLAPVAVLGHFIDPEPMKEGLEEAVRRNSGKPLNFSRSKEPKHEISIPALAECLQSVRDRESMSYMFGALGG